jgi:hypothetical protein
MLLQNNPNIGLSLQPMYRVELELEWHLENEEPV